VGIDERAKFIALHIVNPTRAFVAFYRSQSPLKVSAVQNLFQHLL
jgi:hypothetical protein